MKQLFTLILIVFTIPLFSQIIENSSFETWEELDNGNLEPTDWSSTQTADPDNLANLAPQVIFQSSDAHTGDYCIRLKNVDVVIAGIVSNGLATNGRVFADFNPELGNVHTDTADAQWNTSCLTRPDSVVGYYKYSPVDEDVSRIQVLFHHGGTGVIPDVDSTGWVGMAIFESPNETISEWTRFSAAVDYFNDDLPEYVLFNISAGDATNAIAGSQGWYDDLEFVYNPVGLDENVANALLSAYSTENNIIVDMRKFGAGEKFTIEIYSVSGQLIVQDQIISGSTGSWTIKDSGVYICNLQSKDGLKMAKKVFVK